MRRTLHSGGLSSILAAWGIFRPGQIEKGVHRLVSCLITNGNTNNLARLGVVGDAITFESCHSGHDLCAWEGGNYGLISFSGPEGAAAREGVDGSVDVETEFALFLEGSELG